MKKLFVLLLIVGCAQPTIVTKKYHRKEWKHWIDKDSNCLNTRHEILKSRSLTRVTFKKNGCQVKAGKWADYYYPEYHLLASDVDIDHLVPLKNAHLTGGANWSSKDKETFANDPENLVITKRSYNRKKSDKGIDGWLPVHQTYACKYITDWKKIKKKYNLQLSQAEKNTINIARCP